MRRIAAVAAFAMGLGILAVPATAHEVCSTDGPRPVRTQSNVYYRGSISCTKAHYLSVAVDLYRRQPGGTWNWMDAELAGVRFDISLQANGVFPWDCRKDYRVYVAGVANPGGHEPGGWGQILSHTC